MKHTLVHYGIALAILCGLAPPASAGTSPGRGSVLGVSGARIDAVALPEATAVELDGEFSEEAWKATVPIDAFVQREPLEGAAASLRTEVRVLYDKAYLYVAVRAFDPEPDRIVGIKTRRDDESPSDGVAIFIDSYRDRRTAYMFGVNAAGVKKDGYFFNDGNQDNSWDAVWDVEVSRDSEGWNAEFRIPFSQLRFEPGKLDTFGFAVWRDMPRTNEVSTWPLLSKNLPGFVSQFGDLGGLRLTGSAKRLEFLPYTVGQVQTHTTDEGNPFLSSPDPAVALGADIKYAVTPGLTLTSTINPDFGQVEADPAVVNLTAFETLYAERRPFFVEGSGTLKFDLDCNDGNCTGLFYSRRIGRHPQGIPDTPDDGFVSAPLQTTIYGAAKLTGRVGGFSVGAMNAVTGEERAQVALGSSRTVQTAEPLTNYALAQAKREWSNRSSLGFMMTSTNRRLNDDIGFLASRAVTGGVNWDWRVGGSNYAIQGYWVGSTVRGSAEAIDRLQTNAVHRFQRPDAGHLVHDALRTSLNGHAGQVAFGKVGGQTVRFNSTVLYKSPGFDVNDVGYLRRADQIMQSNWIQFRNNTPRGPFRSTSVNFNQWAGWNYAGESLFKGGNINAHAVFTNNWRLSVGFNIEGSGLDDRTTRGGPSFRSKSGKNVWYFLGTDSRKALSGGWSGVYVRDEQGSTVVRYDPEFTWRPTSFLSVSGGVGYEKVNEDTQWVDTVTDTRDRYVFGRMHQQTVSLTARINYTITPTLTVQLYAAPFVSAGAYSDYRELVKPHAASFRDQFTPYAYADNPDFNYKSFRTTNVLRWEFKPGSALYLVWQQGRELSVEQGRFRFGQDFRDIFGLPGSNVFLVKFSYWLNL